MTTVLVLQLVLFVILLLFSAFFSSSETSFFSLTPTQLERMRYDANPRVDLIERMLNQPRRLIVTILIGNEFVNVAASVTSAALLIALMGDANKWINLLVMVPILLVFGEITPKTLALRHNVAFASAQSRPLERFAWAITPLREVVRRIADAIITLLIGKERSRRSIVTEDMVRTLAEEAVGEGALDPMEAKYVAHIFDLTHLTAGDLRTPRSQIQYFPVDMPMAEMVRKIRKSRHRRIPVYQGTRDRILGVLFARDLLNVDIAAIRDRAALRQVLREPYLVPETKSAADLLEDLRQRRQSVALTVDEFGGVTGLVTMEDLLERIFGEIRSPSERIRSRFKRRSAARYRITGKVPVAEFNKRTGHTLPVEPARTLGGFLLHVYGELPGPGTIIEHGDLRFTITSLHGNRVHGVVVEGLAFPDDDEDTPKTGGR